MSDWVMINDLTGKVGQAVRLWSARPLPDTQPYYEGVLTQVDNDGFVQLDDQVWVNLCHVELIGPGLVAGVSPSERPIDLLREFDAYMNGDGAYMGSPFQARVRAALGATESSAGEAWPPTPYDPTVRVDLGVPTDPPEEEPTHQEEGNDDVG